MSGRNRRGSGFTPTQKHTQDTKDGGKAPEKTQALRRKRLLRRFDVFFNVKRVVFSAKG